MEDFFGIDGPLLNFLHKAGNLILASLLFVICCIPLITIGASASALYYAVVKSIRRERGYPVREFMRAFRRNLINGSVLTLVIAALSAILLYNREILAHTFETVQGGIIQNGSILTGYVIYDGLLFLLLIIVVYLFPVLSRFSMKLLDIVKLSFVIAIRFFYFTIILVGGLFAVLWLQWKILPVATIAVIPGIYAYLSSYLIERAMKKYTPTPKEGEDAWYLE